MRRSLCLCRLYELLRRIVVLVGMAAQEAQAGRTVSEDLEPALDVRGGLGGIFVGIFENLEKCLQNALECREMSSISPKSHSKIHPKTEKCPPKSSDSWLYENAFDR